MTWTFKGKTYEVLMDELERMETFLMLGKMRRMQKAAGATPEDMLDFFEEFQVLFDGFLRRVLVNSDIEFGRLNLREAGEVLQSFFGLLRGESPSPHESSSPTFGDSSTGQRASPSPPDTTTTT